MVKPDISKLFVSQETDARLRKALAQTLQGWRGHDGVAEPVHAADEDVTGRWESQKGLTRLIELTELIGLGGATQRVVRGISDWRFQIPDEECVISIKKDC